jgi:molybdopterin synthase catalytic subunit
MNITDIILLFILTLHIVAIIKFVGYLKERDNVESVRFSATSVMLDDHFTQINGHQLETIGLMRRLVAEMEDYRRDFALTLNKELANKVQAILDAGEKPEHMMKVIDPITKKETWEPMDHGW